MIDCAIGTLSPYVPTADNPWNQQKALHLSRRLGFGTNWGNIENMLTQNPTNLIDTLIDEAINLPLPSEPEWAFWQISDYVANGSTDPNQDIIEDAVDWARTWMSGMTGAKPLREKLSLFWHNHFATVAGDYGCASWLYQYHKLLQEHCLGNFKDFVYEIGKTPAMLVFLNGVQNTILDPNENYARELFELFTLGVDNGYTQQDITGAARALTGWNNINVDDLCGPINFLPIAHDNSSKTIFGQTNNFGYDSLHDLLFEERGNLVAEYICGKIYRAFVHPDAEADEIINELAATFVNNNFELAPVFRQLFKSEHFFDEANIGVQIKSPLEFLFEPAQMLGYEHTTETLSLLFLGSAGLGQHLFNPPNVAGWPGNRTWIDNNSLTQRWSQAGQLLYFLFLNEPELMRTFAKNISNNSNDPEVIAQKMVDFLLPKGFQESSQYERATIALKSEVPENYYTDGSWSLDWDSAPAQVTQLIYFVSQVPEYQLS